MEDVALSAEFSEGFLSHSSVSTTARCSHFHCNNPSVTSNVIKASAMAGISVEL